jgi:hypothetical protein
MHGSNDAQPRLARRADGYRSIGNLGREQSDFHLLSFCQRRAGIGRRKSLNYYRLKPVG